MPPPMSRPGSYLRRVASTNLIVHAVAGLRQPKRTAVPLGQAEHLRAGLADGPVRQKAYRRQVGMDEVDARHAGGAGLLARVQRVHRVGGRHDGLIHHFKLQTAVEREVHCFGVAGFVARLRFQAEGSLLGIHPQIHRHPLRHRPALAAPRQRQQPPRLRVQRAAPEEMRERRRCNRDHHNEDGHDENQFDQGECGGVLRTAWRADWKRQGR